MNNLIKERNAKESCIEMTLRQIAHHAGEEIEFIALSHQATRLNKELIALDKRIAKSLEPRIGRCQLC